MVGIAGEDDLDAPPDVTDEAKAVDTGLALNPSVASTPVRASQFQTGSPGTPPVREKLGAKESAAIRDKLIREIEALPEEDLQPHAIAILKGKNRLSADDAKLVEKAFEVRTALRVALPEAPETDETTSVSVDVTAPELPSALAFTVKPAPRRGRPRKSSASTEAADASRIVSAAVIADNPAPASTRRHRDKAHLKFVASQPCLVCGRSPADAHHLRFTQPRAMGRKVSDEFTVPLCRTHHRDNHRFGDEQAWWNDRAIDAVGTSRQLWVSTRRIE
jgi:hypothetical protein